MSGPVDTASAIQVDPKPKQDKFRTYEKFVLAIELYDITVGSGQYSTAVENNAAVGCCAKYCERSEVGISLLARNSTVCDM